jgi:hypothetical protein
MVFTLRPNLSVPLLPNGFGLLSITWTQLSLFREIAEPEMEVPCRR